MSEEPRRVLITGAAGYLGSQVVRRLAESPSRWRVTALDAREVPPQQRLPGVTYVALDVRDPALADVFVAERPATVVHLASIVQSGGPARREFERSVDVGGTENVLRSCLAAGVRQLIVTSSGAAYGYHADNPSPLREDDPLRGNPEFAYADHKRQIEQLLADYRLSHPQLKQLVFRPGTILGPAADNQITRLFRGRFVLGVAGCETPFVLIWDQDVVECILRGIEQEAAGVYNLAGDGTLSLREMARIMHKPYLPVPATLLRAVLCTLQRLGLSVHGPEQVMFLEHRPVLATERLKSQFGYTPRKTTRQVFDLFLSQQRAP